MDIISQIGRRLSPLASHAAQDRFMLNATKNTYLLPEEVINNASWLVHALDERNPVKSLSGMDTQTKAAILEFARIWRSEDKNIDALLELSWDELVLHNPTWRTLKVAAQTCLHQIGFDLATWELDEGLERSV